MSCKASSAETPVPGNIYRVYSTYFSRALKCGVTAAAQYSPVFGLTQFFPVKTMFMLACLRLPFTVAL